MEIEDYTYKARLIEVSLKPIKKITMKHFR